MPFSSNETLMTALGFDPEVGRLYERLVHQSGETIDGVARGLGVTPMALLGRLQPLVEPGIVRVAEGLVHVAPPAEMVALLIKETAEGAAYAHQRLQEIAAAMPYLSGGRPTVPQTRETQPIDGEIVTSVAIGEAVAAAITQSMGDLMWLRPDEFYIDFEDEMTRWIRDAVAAGRRVRGIYPVSVMQEAPGVVAHRVRIGEEIRLLPELPTRLLVVGNELVMMPEPLGYAALPGSVIRQQGIVEAVRLLFEEMWSRAAPVGHTGVGPDNSRRFLLEQLASGAQDEQIARRLGVSLRTVRRRVAELMEELGAGSRFQAGVEAARRGWL